MIQILLKDIYSIKDIPTKKPCWIEEKRWNSIQKIKTDADKRRSFVSGILLDSMCQDMGINTPVYELTERGKPYLVGVDCAFNISHSGDYVVLAYHANTEPLGIDIQKVRAMRDGMQKRILHEMENSLLPEDSGNEVYHLNRLWAIKESFVKMTGEGLSQDFRTVYVDFENGTVQIGEHIRAQFSVWEWKSDYFLSICSKSKEECVIKEI